MPRTECPKDPAAPRAGPSAETTPDTRLGLLCWAGRAGSGSKGGLLGSTQREMEVAQLGSAELGSGGTKATSAKLQAKCPSQNHPKPLQKDPSRPQKPPGHGACPATAARASTGPAWLQRSPILPVAQRGAPAASDPTAAQRVKKIKTRTQEQQLFKARCPAARSPCPGALRHGSHSSAWAGVYYFSFYCAESPFFPARLSPQG